MKRSSNWRQPQITGSVLALAVFALVGGRTFAQDLKIDFQFNIAGPDKANYLSFSGPIRSMAVDKDGLDAVTGASAKRSTDLFMPYYLDVKGKNTLPNGLRGLLLFAVAPDKQRTDDNFSARKAANGVITIQFIHRGTAYGLITDAKGQLTLPQGQYYQRVIGYIQDDKPQQISKDFSSNGSVAGIDWAKVWSPATPDGREISAGVATKTGPRLADLGAAEAMYGWTGSLQVSLNNNILKLQGGLNAVKK